MEPEVCLVVVVAHEVVPIVSHQGLLSDIFELVCARWSLFLFHFFPKGSPGFCLVKLRGIGRFYDLDPPNSAESPGPGAPEGGDLAFPGLCSSIGDAFVVGLVGFLCGLGVVPRPPYFKLGWHF